MALSAFVTLALLGVIALCRAAADGEHQGRRAPTPSAGARPGPPDEAYRTRLLQELGERFGELERRDGRRCRCGHPRGSDCGRCGCSRFRRGWLGRGQE